MENTYTKFQFKPSLNDTTKKLVKNMEKSFTRITRTKPKKQIEPEKKSISKEKYQKSLDRINFLYSDGLEKIKKKKNSNSKLNEDEINDLLNNEKFGKTFEDCLKSIKKNKSSRNIYNKQIQWKRNLLLKNELKKKRKNSIKVISNINNKKNKKEKQIRNSKDINNNYLILKNEISLSSEKINQSKNIFYRLYNHGFYLKNKSQMNILSNLIQIKKDSERKNISKKSQEILGLNNNKNVKYSKDNIFKPIKTNMESTYTKFQFQPSLNETTKKLVKNMEKSFTRITRPKSKNQIEHQKKSISKEKLQKTLDRINFLYTDGLEKIKKKKISNSKLKEDENNDSLSNEKFGKTFDDCLKSIKSSKSSRNIYNKQIQWKRKLLMKNELKKKIEESKNSKECTFKPDITTKSIKYLFQKTAEEKNKTKNSKDINQNSINKSLNNKNKMLISQKRYFIINNEKKLLNNRIKNKNNFKEKYKNKKIEYSLYQRKTYHLEKFFS